MPFMRLNHWSHLFFHELGFSNKYFPIVRKPFILNCTAAKDTPMLPVRWLKNGQPFQPDGQRVFPRSSSLVFSSVMPDDSGHYTCIVGDNQKAENVIVDVIFHGKLSSGLYKISKIHACFKRIFVLLWGYYITSYSNFYIACIL